QTYKVFVDRAINNPEFSRAIPEQVFNQKSIILPVTVENGDTLLVNEKQVKIENNSINLKLDADKNEFNIQSQDQYGNTSLPKSIIITNNTDPKWKEYTCGSLKYYLDSTKLQHGYSGVEDRPEFEQGKDEEFSRINSFGSLCNEGSISSAIYPLNSKAGCWNCGGNYSYINVTKNSRLLNRPDIKQSIDYPYITEAKEYITKSGITGDLIKKTLELESGEKDKTIKNSTIIFTFSINEEEYVINATERSNSEWEDDFMSVIDTLTLTKPTDKQDNSYSKTAESKTYSFTQESPFEISANSDWKVYESKGELEGYKSLNLNKGTYTIRIDQFTSEKNGNGISKSEVEISKTKQMKIGDLDVLVPLVSKVKPIASAAGAFNFDVLFEESDGYTNELTSGDYNYSVIVYNDDSMNSPTKFDTEIEKEILEILESIKW
ncbi:MAG: hypothetical protein ACRCXZ_03500, partial [Patescibacteria group bacterium]